MKEPETLCQIDSTLTYVMLLVNSNPKKHYEYLDEIEIVNKDIRK